MHRNSDQYRPRLAKEEFKNGNVMVYLCSKTYVLESKEENIIKLSCKGMIKHFVDKPLKIFRNVLKNGVKKSSTNRGFICKFGKAYSYQQDRIGFNFLYMKRQVQPDGFSTKALTCQLSPWDDRILENFDGYKHPLSNLYPCPLDVYGVIHQSSEHMFQYYKAKFHGEQNICDEICHEWNVMKARNSAAWFDVERLVMKKRID